MGDIGSMGAIGRILVSGLSEKGGEVNVFTFLVYYLPFDSPCLVDKEAESIYPH